MDDGAGLAGRSDGGSSAGCAAGSAAWIRCVRLRRDSDRDAPQYVERRPHTFGLLFNLAVDDRIYAQPLYVPNVAVPNQGTHNVVYVATMSDTVYAFDADKGGKPLWSVNLAGLFNTTAVSWPEFSLPPVLNPGNLGILSTPVIDPSTNVMYVVACDLEGGTMAYRLHALDITTGEEPYGRGC